MRAERIEETAKLLNRRGYAVIESLVEPSAMDLVAAELRPHFDSAASERRHNATDRIHSRVLATAPELQQRMVDPVVLGVMDLILGPNCVRYQLSSVQGIEVHPGAADQSLHRDDDVFRLPHPHPVFEVNVMWALTDFTAKNGATRVVPGSHAWPSGKTAEPGSEVLAVMPKGSVLPLARLNVARCGGEPHGSTPNWCLRGLLTWLATPGGNDVPRAASGVRPRDAGELAAPHRLRAEGDKHTRVAGRPRSSRTFWDWMTELPSSIFSWDFSSETQKLTLHSTRRLHPGAVRAFRVPAPPFDRQVRGQPEDVYEPSFWRQSS